MLLQCLLETTTQSYAIIGASMFYKVVH